MQLYKREDHFFIKDDIPKKRFNFKVKKFEAFLYETQSKYMFLVKYRIGWDFEKFFTLLCDILRKLIWALSSRLHLVEFKLDE